MKLITCLTFILAPYQNGQSFTLIPSAQRLPTTSLNSSPDPEKMKQILIEESTNPENMKAAAEMMKSMKPEEIDTMLSELDSMPDAQFQAMGMDKSMLRQSLSMIKDNPQMMDSMSEMMSNMSPEELLEKSRKAQQDMTVLSAAAPVVDVEPEQPSTKKQRNETILKSAEEEDVVDAMFNVAELMSNPPTGGVAYQGFRSLPVISLLIGTDSEADLTEREAKECWADGSLGATRVDREGFQRVWDEVKEYFDEDIMEEARERAGKRKKKRGGAKPVNIAPGTPAVGATLPPEVLEQQVKNMSDSDIDAMLNSMKNMSPEEEARMKAMGVNPAMMKRTAQMMSSNPLMRNAAKTMMKNMSADQMVKASQQVQSQMQNMSEEDMNKMMQELENKK